MQKSGLLLLLLFLLTVSCSQKLKIGGTAGYQIVIPSQADTMEVYSATQLRHYLSEMSGTDIPVIREKDYSGKAAIYIGKTEYAKKMNTDFASLEEDGYTYRVKDKNYVIAGGSAKGALYGIYDLLEYLGFRKYTSDCTIIPKANSINFPANDTTVIPKIKYRTTLYYDTTNPEYSDWHKLSSQSATWGSFVHTFLGLMPPEKYFKSHPEYYALRDGRRLPTQLCLSNPEVVDTLIKNLKTEIGKRPGLKYWSVSQADNDKPCLCDKCIKLNQQYGGDKSTNSGAIIYFVNQVAKAFPDKIISTLAYWYARKAPENIKPEPNVNIMLCNIESERHQPVFQTDPAFSNDLKNWGRLSNNILIWDYEIQFSNLVSPFPNLHTIKPNLKFFTDNNVNAFFMQANGQLGGEMSELRAYLISKLLWNPDADDKTIMNDFVKGYYGNAGQYIGQYIDTMQYALVKSGHHLSIFGSPEEAKDTYLSSEMMGIYNKLFDEAEKAVEKEPVLLRRVQIARLPLMYARIQISRTETDTPRSLFKHDQNGRIVTDPAIEKLLRQFVDRLKDQGVKLLREREITPDDYLASYSRIIRKVSEMDSVISFNKKIIPITSPSKEYKGLESLTDGVFGSYEDWRDVRYDNWVGYEGNHMDFILDLGEIRPIKSINMDFFDGKDTWYMMALPEFVTYSTSTDGKNYSNSVKVVSPVDPEEPETDSMPRVIYVQSFTASMENCNARYIKVHAESMLKCPAWHVRAGDPVTIYSDEIVVR